MKDNKKIAWASSTLGGKIWIPPNGRPFWTHQNRSGNALLPLTNKQLKKHGLSQLKKYPYSRGDAITYKLGNFEKLTIWEDIYIKWESRKNLKWTWKKIFTKWEKTIPRWVKENSKITLIKTNKDYKFPEGWNDPKPWDDKMEKTYQRALKANRKMIEKYKK